MASDHSAIATRLVNDQSLLAHLVALKDRWADERKYEKIEEYGESIKAVLPAGCQYIRMTKRPFGPVLTIDGRRGDLQLFVKSRGNQVWLALKAA